MSEMKTVVVNCREQEYDVFIGRPSKWGNPFKIGRDGSRIEVMFKFKLWLAGRIKAPGGEKAPTIDEIVNELKGKRLGCFCTPLACHGDIYVDIADDKFGARAIWEASMWKG